MKSLTKALSVMDLIFADQGQGLSIADISREIGLPKATSHRILASLVQFKYARQDPRTKRYGLGARFLDIGSPFEKRQMLRAFIAPVLHQLRSKCAETLSVAILVKDEIEYIERYESGMTLRVDIHVGTRFPAYCNCYRKDFVGCTVRRGIGTSFKSPEKAPEIHGQIHQLYRGAQTGFGTGQM